MQESSSQRSLLGFISLLLCAPFYTPSCLNNKWFLWADVNWEERMLSLPGLWKGWISLSSASMSVRNSPDTAKGRMNSLFTPLGHVTNHETSAPRR